MGDARILYKDLPVKLQEIALSYVFGNTDKERFKENIITLSSAFDWAKTKEGHGFWSDIYNGYEIPEKYLDNEESLVDEKLLFDKVISLIKKVV